MATARAKERYELSFSYVSRTCDLKPLTEVLKHIFDELNYTGTWVIGIARQIRWKSPARFEVIHVRGGAIRCKVRGPGSDNSWEVDIKPPSTYIIDTVHDQLDEWSGFEGKFKPVKKERVVEKQAVLPPQLSVVSAEPEKPQPAKTDEDFLSKLSNVTARIKHHETLLKALQAADDSLKVAYERLEQAESRRLAALKAVEDDIEGKRAIELKESLLMLLQ